MCFCHIIDAVSGAWKRALGLFGMLYFIVFEWLFLEIIAEVQRDCVVL